MLTIFNSRGITFDLVEPTQLACDSQQLVIPKMDFCELIEADTQHHANAERPVKMTQNFLSFFIASVTQ